MKETSLVRIPLANLCRNRISTTKNDNKRRQQQQQHLLQLLKHTLLVVETFALGAKADAVPKNATSSIKTLIGSVSQRPLCFFRWLSIFSLLCFLFFAFGSYHGTATADDVCDPTS